MIHWNSSNKFERRSQRRILLQLSGMEYSNITRNYSIIYIFETGHGPSKSCNRLTDDDISTNNEASAVIT